MTHRNWTAFALIGTLGIAPVALADSPPCQDCSIYDYQMLTGGGSARTYQFSVSAGHTYTISVRPGGGNPNLYTRYGATPTTTAWDCRPNSSGTTQETCTLRATMTGTEYVMVQTVTGPSSYLIWACDAAKCK